MLDFTINLLKNNTLILNQRWLWRDNHTKKSLNIKIKQIKANRIKKNTLQSFNLSFWLFGNYFCFLRQLLDFSIGNFVSIFENVMLIICSAFFNCNFQKPFCVKWFVGAIVFTILHPWTKICLCHKLKNSTHTNTWWRILIEWKK